MRDIAVIGDYDSIYGFAALGFDTIPVTEPAEAKHKLSELAEQGYGIIYITEFLAADLREEIAKYQDKIVPAIIEIPGTHGNTGAGIAEVKKSVERAVGSDILFSHDN